MESTPVFNSGESAGAPAAAATTSHSQAVAQCNTTPSLTAAVQFNTTPSLPATGVSDQDEAGKLVYKQVLLIGMKIVINLKMKDSHMSRNLLLMLKILFHLLK